VRLRGVFDHTEERHIFTAPPRAPGVPATARAGYWVLTPLRLEGTGRIAHVNRGFVPDDRKAADSRAAGQPSGTVEIVGLYRTADRRATFDGANDPAGNVWYVRDPAELWPRAFPAATSPGGAWPVAYVDMTGPPPGGGLPLPLGGRTTISNRHLEYALTWYGLAGTLLAVYGAFAWGRLRRPGGTT
jgi:surfeit locus 1 family protein